MIGPKEIGALATLGAWVIWLLLLLGSLIFRPSAEREHARVIDRLLVLVSILLILGLGIARVASAR